MKTVQVREAKATLSALIEAAELGTPTMITRHGKAAAVLVPIDDARRIYGDAPQNFAAALIAFPGLVELERLEGRMRDIFA